MESSPETPVPPSPSPKSTTGLDENVAAALAYLLGFITGIVFLVLEKDSKFVRFHAMQSTITFVGIWILSVVVWQVPIIGWLIGLLLMPVTLVLWLLLMFKAFQNEKFKLPGIGDIAEQKA